MSITGELRDWYKDRIFMANGWQEINDIADRIDAEHERQLEVLYRDMSDAEYVELPKDADGVPIHVGDVMEWIDLDGEVTVTCSVDAVGVDCFFAWDKGNRRYAQKCANAYRHYHAPTVEDMLREFADGWDFAEGAGKGDSYIKTLAAKLRLAEEEDA